MKTKIEMKRRKIDEDYEEDDRGDDKACKEVKQTLGKA
jgi:hypothetical protein